MTMEGAVTTTEVEIPAGEFKARCLKLMDEVRTTRRPIVITKRGKPVARLVADGGGNPAARDLRLCATTCRTYGTA
jgi:prevent-host-death family protein